MSDTENHAEKLVYRQDTTQTTRRMFPWQLWSRRKRWIVGALASFCILALILGLSIGLTRPGRTHSDSSEDDGSNDTNYNNTGNGGDGYTGDGYHGSQQWPNPEPIKGVIPNNTNYITLDPTVMRRADGKYFLLTTRTPYGATWTADSLYGPWELQGDTLTEQGGAPDLQKIGDTYYMFHNQHFKYDALGVTNPEAMEFWHDSSIVVQTSKTMEAKSWKRQGRLNITWSMNYNALDASFMIINTTDAQGQVKKENLLTFGSYQIGLFQLPLADPPVELAQGAMEQMTHLEQNQTALAPRGQTEASYMYQRHGWHYLFFSSGRCCPQRSPKTQLLEWMNYDQAYRVMVCRSRRPRGGYVDKDGKDCLSESGGTLILGNHDQIFAPGGQGVMDDPEVGLVLYYHYIRFDHTRQTVDPDRKGYFFGFNKLRFDRNDWPYVDGQ